LIVLKQLHSSGDLNMLCNEAKWAVGDQEHKLIEDLLKNFGDQDTLRQIDRVTILRSKLNQFHIDVKQQTHKLRDILFLDLALESYVKTLCDRIVHIDIGFTQFARQIALIIENLQYGFQWEEIKMCCLDWK